MPSQKTAIIIGAGPAGLTAAYELLKRTDIKPIVLEKSSYTGGIARTVEHNGNRIDIGGHRFFSKSDRVMKWWLNIMPLEEEPEIPVIAYQNQQTMIPDQELEARQNGNLNMLVRKRVSRIYYMKKLLSYPLKLSIETMSKLGMVKVARIGLSYFVVKLRKSRPEKNLEDFFINRFGKELYYTFFKSYTEKVWGISCDKISPEWGAQRIKELSVSKALLHFLKSKRKKAALHQKQIETSLIEQFLYPKMGPGQLWEEVERQVIEMGGMVHHNIEAVNMQHENGNIHSLVARDISTGIETKYKGAYFFSTMPVKDLVAGMTPAAPETVREIAEGLEYRDFITVGLLLNELKIRDHTSPYGLIKDTWIYIQEEDVKIGRLQIFNNWSPYMISDKSKVWLGLEYFCNKKDELWQMDDKSFIAFAVNELDSMGIIEKKHVLDSIIIRDEKTYPAYFGTYDRFDIIKEYLSEFNNLFLVGRNGMHKYNNSDHAMLTAMTAVDNIIAGIDTKENIWKVNTEQEYHETSKNNNPIYATQSQTIPKAY